MRLLLATLLLSTALFACSNSCNAKKSNLMDSLQYALILMDLHENADIKTAIALYKRDMQALDRGINTDAFKEGKFDPVVYEKEHVAHKKIAAQIDLFDTLYLVFNAEQKKKFHQLIAAHQHYQSLLKRESGCQKKSHCNTSCGEKRKGCKL